jgi:hypothetical protein
MSKPHESPRPAPRPIVVTDIGAMSDDEIEAFADIFIGR